MTRHQRARRIIMLRGIFIVIGFFTIYIVALGVVDRIQG